MYDPREHVVHCVNGCLREGNPNATTTLADVRRLVDQALAKAVEPELVIHLHGGLVDKAAGYAIAARLCDRYQSDARYPIFFVWESGLVESIRNNLTDISHDRLFQQLVKRAVWWVIQQVPANLRLKGAGAAADRGEYDSQFDAFFLGKRGELPDAVVAATEAEDTLRSAAAPIDLSDNEKQEDLERALKLKIESDLAFDGAFKAELQELYDEISVSDVQHPAPKPGGIGRVVTTASEIAPTQVSEVFEISTEEKGIFTVAKVAWFLAKVVVRALKRLLSGRGHGIYTTVVEEILAGLYVDKIGGVIWQQMKKDTQDAFGSPETAAGAAFLAEIPKAQQRAGKSFKRITLIGHSTGAVYICNLLEAAAHFLPDQKFGVIFLAPAVTYEAFSATLKVHASRISGFRRFGMKDAVEADDVIVPVIYLRSLLYFVSSLLEFTGGSNPERGADTPLVGMQRYSADGITYSAGEFPAVLEVEAYIAHCAHGTVWSVTPDGTANGIASRSTTHGGFDDENTTIDSVVEILSNGF